MSKIRVLLAAAACAAMLFPAGADAASRTPAPASDKSDHEQLCQDLKLFYDEAIAAGEGKGFAEKMINRAKARRIREDAKEQRCDWAIA